MRTFFPGMATCWGRTNTFKWSVSHALLNPALCRGFRRRCQIGGIIFELLIFDSPSKILATHSTKPPSTAPMQQQSVLSIISSNDNAHEQWKWGIFGLAKKKHKMGILLNGTPAKRIWRTIKVNITLGHTTPWYTHITYMRKTLTWYYHGQEA